MQETFEPMHWQFDINYYELEEKDRQILREILDTYFNYIAVRGLLVTEKISREDLEEINQGRYEILVSTILEEFGDYNYVQLKVYNWPMKQGWRI